MLNPFSPSFGNRPTYFFGRQEITRSIVSAVYDKYSPWRTTLITGIRGSGKTALLSDIRISFDEQNVIALYVVPNEAMLDNILVQLYRQLPKTAAEIFPKFNDISINLGVKVGFEKNTKTPYFTETFSYQFLELMDAYMKHEMHVVFLIDEAQKHTEDMRIFISTYQDLVMREYSVSMVMAGLQSVISDVLNDDILTFLRRAKQIELENVELIIVEHEFKKVFLQTDAELPEELISKIAIATHGYPYLIQLMGYYLWKEMQHNRITDLFDDVMYNSKAELFRNVHRLIFTDLSNMDREFVFAMSEDEKCSSVSDIGKRLGKQKNYISLYRERLISAGIVKPAGHGLLRFNYPYMQEFLLQKQQERV
ncbi:MAG: ATP-binding protein [Oscillospiraceae bacterium]|nr:ATP-binding protein [Oscillospiraceae bacterium]